MTMEVVPEVVPVCRGVMLPMVLRTRALEVGVAPALAEEGRKQTGQGYTAVSKCKHTFKSGLL